MSGFRRRSRHLGGAEVPFSTTKRCRLFVTPKSCQLEMSAESHLGDINNTVCVAAQKGRWVCQV